MKAFHAGAAAVLLFRLACAPQAAQAADLEAARPAAVVFSAVDLAPAAESAGLGDVIGTSLAARLEEAGFRVVPAGAAAEAELAALDPLERAQGARLAGLAGKLGADLAIGGYFGLEGARVFVELKAYAAHSGDLVAGRLFGGLAGLAAFDLINSAIDELLPDLAAWMKHHAAGSFKAAQRGAPLTFSSLVDGVELRLGGRLPLGTSAGGGLTTSELAFPDGARISVEARREGYYPQTREFTIESGRSAYELPLLRRKTVSDFSLYAVTGQLPGAGLTARMYPVPDYVFLNLSNYFYVQHNFRPENHPVLHDEIAAGFGGYVVFPHDSWFRLYLSAGLGAWLTVFSVPRMPWYLDMYINFLTAGFEFNFAGFSLFLESQGKFSINTGRGLLGQNFVGVNNGPPPIALGVRFR